MLLKYKLKSLYILSLLVLPVLLNADASDTVALGKGVGIALVLGGAVFALTIVVFLFKKLFSGTNSLYRKLEKWYTNLNKKQRIILWLVTLPYAIFPITGILLGGIPFALSLIVIEFNRES